MYILLRFCGTNDYCWIHHGRTISISLDSVEDPVKEVNKMYRRNGKKYAHTDKVYKRGEEGQLRGFLTPAFSMRNSYVHVVSIISTACEEAVELYMKHKNEQEKSKPLPKQESKAYTKLKVNFGKNNQNFSESIYQTFRLYTLVKDTVLFYISDVGQQVPGSSSDHIR